jgi:glucosamine-6-phosphate deaminase
MKLIVTKNYAALSQEAALQIAIAVEAKPSAAIVVATGNTPVGAYEQLAALKAIGQFDPAKLTIFQLDEYLGLAADDKRTLWGWMERAFLTPLGLSPQKVVRLNTDTADAEATCRAYDSAVQAAGGFDLCILGLGPNGHLAFNEPPVEATSDTRVVTLTEESIESNSLYWGGRDQVPPQAMTAGLRPLLAAKLVILLVSGAKKRDILRRVMSGPVTGAVPASFLQLHANVIVIADKDAVA